MVLAKQATKAKRYIFLALGFLALTLGIVGIFLPVVPTTPFLIAAAFCFNRGSDKFHSWLLNHKWFGPPIRDWLENRSISKKHKLLAALTMLGSCVLVGFKGPIPLWGKVLYTVFILSVLAYILTRRSRPARPLS